MNKGTCLLRLMEKIDQVNSFIYIGSIIGEDGGSSEAIKIRTAKTQGVYSHFKKV